MGDLEFWVWVRGGARENVRKRELTVRVRECSLNIVGPKNG